MVEEPDHRLEVESGAANVEIKSVLGIIGVQPEDVERVHLNLVMVGELGGRTETEITTSGDSADTVLSKLLPAMEWEHEKIESLAIEVSEKDQEEDETEEGDESEDEGEHPRAGEERNGSEWKSEPDVSSPQPVTRGSKRHHALQILSDMVEESDDGWITSTEFFEANKDEWPTKPSAAKCLSVLYVEKALIDRRKRASGQGFEYTTTKYTNDETFIVEDP